MNKNYKKLILKYQYLLEELQDTEDDLQTVQTLFNKEIEDDERTSAWNDHAEELNENEAAEEKQEASDDDDCGDDESMVHPKIMKTIYRRLSRVCHPDISADPSSEATFVELSAAYAEQNYLLMLILAIELDVNIDDLKRQISKKHFKHFKKSINKLEEKISKHQGSFAWMWYNEEDEKKKEAIKELFLRTIDNMRQKEGRSK